MEILSKILAVAAGGAFGAVARYLLNIAFAKVFVPFPSATFFVNITGSFLVGFLAEIFTERLSVGENLRLFLVVGFLGAYTTFSTFELETFVLIRQKNLPIAFLYVAASFAVGMLGVISGFVLGRKITA